MDVICLGVDEQSETEVVNGVTVKRIMKVFPKNSIFHYLLFSTLFFIKAILYFVTFLSIKNKYSLIQIHNMPDHLVFVAFFQNIFGVPVLLDIHDLTLELFREKWSNLLFNLILPFSKIFRISIL